MDAALLHLVGVHLARDRVVHLARLFGFQRPHGAGSAASQHLGKLLLQLRSSVSSTNPSPGGGTAPGYWRVGATSSESAATTASQSARPGGAPAALTPFERARTAFTTDCTSGEQRWARLTPSASVLGQTARGGPRKMSASYLWLLRTGVRDNPSRKHLEAIAAFFAVPINYFFDDALAAEMDADLQLVRALRKVPVRELALRAAELSPEGLDEVAHIVEHVRRLEGLPHNTHS